MSENLCRAVGCDSECCTGRTRFLPFQTEAELLDYFPSAKLVDPNILPELRMNGLFYSPLNAGMFQLRMIGPCPYSAPIGCEIYPKIPTACKNLKLKSKVCNEFRKNK